jgi:hypothetical protein
MSRPAVGRRSGRHWWQACVPFKQTLREGYADTLEDATQQAETALLAVTQKALQQRATGQ